MLILIKHTPLIFQKSFYFLEKNLITKKLNYNKEQKEGNHGES